METEEERSPGDPHEEGEEDEETAELEEAGVALDEDAEGAEQLIEDNLVPLTEDELLSDDTDSLYDPPAGYEDAANIKKPLLGFSDADEREIFPLVDEQSMVLFEIVQRLEKAHLQSSERTLLRYNKAVTVPNDRLAVGVGGPEIKLRIIDPQAREDSIIQRAVAMATAPDKVPDRILAAIAKDAFPPDKLAMLQEALDKGWKREIVMRSHCSPGKKLGDVYYFSPEGTKFRSSKQVAIFLGKRPDLGLSIDNFSFAKARVSYNPDQESVRQAYGGKSPMPAKQVVRLQAKPAYEPDDSLIIQDDGMVRGGAESDLGMEDGDGKGTGGARGSTSRRSIQPPKRYATGESVFYAEKRAKLSTKLEKDYDGDGSMEMGMLPPKYHKGMEDSNSASTTAVDDPYSDFKRRGRPPKPGGKKDLLAQAEAMKAAKSAAGTYHADEEGAMFGISALTQSAHFGHFSDGMGMDYGHQYGQRNEDNGSFEEESQNQKHEEQFAGADDGLSRDTQELLPCSIRCPGMTGDIPTLQCRRCLCLYHPQCLGLVHANFRHFFCSNCEGQPDDNQCQPLSNQRQRMKGHPMKGMGEPRRIEGKKPPPPLIRANFPRGSSNLKMEPRKILPKMPILQATSPFSRPGGPGIGGGIGGGTTIKSRMEMPNLNLSSLKMMKKPEAEGRSNVSVSSIDMRSPTRRGRPPRNLLIPQLNNRSLTITPISIPRRGMQAPPVPNLQPMMNPRGVIRRPNLPHQNVKGSINPPSLGGSSMFGPPHIVSKRPLLAFPRPNSQQPRFRLPQRSMQGGMRPLNTKQNLVPVPVTFKRYAQSVVSINQKKYIALPKSKDQAKPFLLPEEIKPPRSMKNIIGFNSNGQVDSSDDETDGFEVFSDKDQQTILKNVFSHLGLKDLLNCSVVSELWRSVSLDLELWETIKLENLRITDWQKLCNVILVRQTEILDARGLILEDHKEAWDRLSSLIMMRPSKLIVSPVMIADDEAVNDFMRANPNCELAVE